LLAFAAFLCNTHDLAVRNTQPRNINNPKIAENSLILAGTSFEKLSVKSGAKENKIAV